MTFTQLFPFKIFGYSDYDWAGSIEDRKCSLSNKYIEKFQLLQNVMQD